MRKRTKLAGMKDMAKITQMDTTTSVEDVALWLNGGKQIGKLSGKLLLCTSPGHWQWHQHQNKDAVCPFTHSTKRFPWCTENILLEVNKESKWRQEIFSSQHRIFKTEWEQRGFGLSWREERDLFCWWQRAQSCRRQIYKLWGCGSRFLWLLAGTSSGHTGSIYFQFELATNSLNPKAVTFTSFGKRTKDNGLGEKNRKCCCTVQRKKSMRDFRGDKSHLLPLFFLGKKSDDI